MNTLEAILSESLIDELVAAVGLPKVKFYHELFWSLFRKITDKFALIGATFDEITKNRGFPAACEWALTLFCKNIRVHGADHIPERGPLLVLSNHPGAYDALVIFSNLNGHRIQSVSSEIPFLRLLPNTHKHFLFAPREDARERMVVLRKAVRHLREGGTLNFFGSGHRDPDPCVYPGGEKSIDNWLEVSDFFFRYVKDLKILPVIISGVVSPKWASHPITWFRNKQIDKQRLAEFGQVITQLREPGKLMISPRISFGEPYSESTLREFIGSGLLHQTVIERSKVLFSESRKYFGGFYTESQFD